LRLTCCVVSVVHGYISDIRFSAHLISYLLLCSG